jgi:hypothetical protein
LEKQPEKRGSFEQKSKTWPPAPIFGRQESEVRILSLRPVIIVATAYCRDNFNLVSVAYCFAQRWDSTKKIRLNYEKYFSVQRPSQLKSARLSKAKP